MGSLCHDSLECREVAREGVVRCWPALFEPR
jgi:hypothetical protein